MNPVTPDYTGLLNTLASNESAGANFEAGAANIATKGAVDSAFAALIKELAQDITSALG
jgi:hypothetical protein